MIQACRAWRGIGLMKRSFLILSVCVIALTGITANAAALVGNSDNGKIKAAVCASCHGANGDTTVGNWPKLAGQSPVYLSTQLESFKTGKRQNEIMYGLTQALSDQDIADLSVYYASLSPSYGVAKPDNLSVGESLYRGGDAARQIPACTACHGPRGEGNSAAGFPAVAGQNAPYVLAQLQNFTNKTRQNNAAVIMQEVVARLTNEEMQALANYIAGLH